MCFQRFLNFLISFFVSCRYKFYLLLVQIIAFLFIKLQKILGFRLIGDFPLFGREAKGRAPTDTSFICFLEELTITDHL